MSFVLPELYSEEGIFGPPSEAKLAAVFGDAKHIVDGLKSTALDRASHRWSTLETGNDWWEYVVLNKKSLAELTEEAAVDAPAPTNNRSQGGKPQQQQRRPEATARSRGRGASTARGGRGGKRGGRNNYHYQPRDEITPMRDTFVMKDGERLRDFDFGDLMKRSRQSDLSVVVTDLKMCGLPRLYASEVERARVAAPRKLVACPEGTNFKCPTAFQDPVLRQIIRTVDGELPVIVATEEALSSLMACTRSIHAWHLKCFRFKRFTFLETMEKGKTDVEWVAETNTTNGPSETAILPENRASALGAESTKVAREFVAHSLQKKTCDIKTEKRHDDFKGMTPMFRYRRFDIGGESPFIVLVRCEVDAAMPNTQRPDSLLFLRLFGLLEHAASHQWQDTGAGAAVASTFLAVEMKHNSFKMARWIAKSVLAGADLMKIGMISRNKTPEQHNLVGVMTQDPIVLGNQVGVTTTALWSNAIVLLTALIQESERVLSNGQATLFFVKNANNNVVELIRQDTDGHDDGESDEDEEEEEEDEEEEDEEEEDEEEEDEEAEDDDA